jgi:hypothetical protein
MLPWPALGSTTDGPGAGGMTAGGFFAQAAVNNAVPISSEVVNLAMSASP